VAGLTRSLVTRHALGRADAYDAALLDVAQDHLLYLLAEAGMFTDGQLVFKGGTSLRKCRLGNDGCFSTDLDFAAPNEDTVLHVCGVIDGARVAGFEYRLDSTRGDGRHWDLQVNHPDLGTPDIAASVEFARRPLALPTDHLAFIPLPIRKQYGFALPVLPVVAEAEACAEKLARYRRVALGRDLYDLHQFANRTIDEPLVRRLWVLKVWGDVVDDGRGSKPADPTKCSTTGANATTSLTRSACSPGPWTSLPGRRESARDSNSSRTSTAMSDGGPHAMNGTAERLTPRSLRCVRPETREVYASEWCVVVIF
jgi:uncharacterized protein